MSRFTTLKQEISSVILSLRGEDHEIPSDKIDEIYPHLRRLLCGVVRYPDGHIQAFERLLGEGADMVFDLRDRREVIDVTTLRVLVQGSEASP